METENRWNNVCGNIDKYSMTPDALALLAKGHCWSQLSLRSAGGHSNVYLIETLSLVLVTSSRTLSQAEDQFEIDAFEGQTLPGILRSLWEKLKYCRKLCQLSIYCRPHGLTFIRRKLSRCFYFLEVRIGSLRSVELAEQQLPGLQWLITLPLQFSKVVGKSLSPIHVKQKPALVSVKHAVQELTPCYGSTE